MGIRQWFICNFEWIVDAPQLMIGLHLNKLKISQVANVSNTPNRPTSQLSLTYLKCAQDTNSSLQLGNYFISRALAFLFFSSEAGDRDVHFVGIMGCENTKHNLQETLGTQHSVAYQMFIFLIACLTGSCSSLPLPGITRECPPT